MCVYIHVYTASSTKSNAEINADMAKLKEMEDKIPATHCNRKLKQITATHCNTLQHITSQSSKK